METIYYSYHFGKNEIYVFFLLASGIALMMICRKVFPIKKTMIFFLYSVFMGLLLDHCISIPPLDYYDVNDTSGFDFMDFLTYIMYGPYGYFFAYFYERLHIKTKLAPLYILAWACSSLLAEYLGILMGVFHYKYGYHIYYSLPIYLIVLSLQLSLYFFLQSKKPALTDGGDSAGQPPVDSSLRDEKGG